MADKPVIVDESLTEFGFNRLTNPLKRAVSQTLTVCGSVAAVTCFAGTMGALTAVKKAKELVLDPETEGGSSNVGNNWLEEILMLVGTSLPETRSEVDQLLRQSVHEVPDKPSQFHASRVSSTLIKRKAIKSGVAGGLVSSPGVLPGIGSLGTIALSVTVDLAYLLRTQLELCYGIATAYGVTLDNDEMRSVSLALISFSGSAEAAADINVSVMRDIVDQIAADYVAVGMSKATALLLKKIGSQGSSRTLRFLPFLGIPLGASINIASTVMVGKQAKKYFNSSVENTVSPELPKS